MAVIIDEIQVEVLSGQNSGQTPGQASAGEPATPQPAEGDQEAKLIQMLELARERAERLSCD